VTAAPEQPRLTPGLMALLTATCFTTAGTIHFQTPMLPEFAREFGASAAAVGWVATASFGGFLTGTLSLAPLGDRFDKRRLILAQLGCLIAAMLAMGAAQSLAVLVVAAFCVGIFASISQHILPFIAEFSAPGERGRAIGTVMSGLFLGILFGRLGGGFITSYLGWRWTYVISAAMMLALAPALIARLPSAPPRTRLPYAALMRSLFGLVRSRADLRRASAVQFLLGICYGGFWATLAPMLAAVHGMGPAIAGLFGIPGAAGVLVARPAGRWMDRFGVRPVVTTGICLVMAAYLTFGFGVATIAAIVIGAILQDCGLRSAMVANQAMVTTADPETRSRSNTIFAIHVWGGNATGAFIASIAWAYAGWPGVCASGVAASLVALAVYLRRRAPR
jgi:predicted MFS family arabinose efflux permease